jgi:hypothetical protein
VADSCIDGMGKKGSKKRKKKKTPKNKIIQELAKQEPKSRKKLFLGLGLAGIALATVAGGGLIRSCYEKEKDRAAALQIMYGMESNKKWFSIVNEEGIFVSEKGLENKYELFRENAKIQAAPADKKKNLEKILIQKLDGVVESFKENPVPEMYNEEMFYSMWSTVHNHQELLLSTDKIADIFGLYQGNPLVTELFNNLPKTDAGLIGKMLNCSVLLVHKKLEIREDVPGETIDKFIKNLRNGVGNCSDYTYAVANIYYTLCHSIKRDDLCSKIKIMTGMYFKPDGNFKEYHAWLQYFGANKEWNNLEMNQDRIKANDLITLSTPALDHIGLIGEGGAYIPLFSTMIIDENNELKIKFKAHIWPQEKSER